MPVDSSVLRARILRWGNAVFESSIESAVEELREAAPLGQTGDTRRLIQSQPGGTTTHPAATIVSLGKGGTFVEYGTQPHVIRPVRAKALRFLGGGGRISQAGPSQRIATRGSGVVFAMVVDHPGFPPRPWFDPVIQRWSETHLQRAGEAVAF